MSDRDIHATGVQLSPQAMRALGYRVVDLLIEHFEHVAEQGVGRTASRPEMETLLRQPLPQEGTDPLDVLNEACEKVFDNIMYLDHPRFVGYIPSPNNFVSVMADTLASGFNVFNGAWEVGAGPAQIELVTIDWLRDLCGLPESGGGLFTSGGSMANLMALCIARDLKLEGDTEKATIYCSDQTHITIERGLRILGFRPEQLRRLPSDENFRLDVSALCGAIETDRKAGHRPFCVLANAGTISTGAVDPLLELAELCREEGLWLHVDGAYGAAAVFCEEGREAVRGLEAVDSLTLDPHKWLFQPYEIGCLLVRKAEWLKKTFYMVAEYLEDNQYATEKVNFRELSPQLTRSFRALKLWMSLKTFGAAGFSRAVGRGFELARVAESIIERQAGWEVVTPAQMGIVTCRYAPAGVPESKLNALNEALVEAINRDGTALITYTRLRGKVALRLCTINPRTREADICQILERLTELACELQSERFA